MAVYNAKTILKESIPILILLVIIGTFGGFALNYKLESFVKYPVLLLLIPVLNATCGNLASLLSARLSSALHTGYIKPKFSSKRLKNNLYATIILAMIVFAFLCFLLLIISFIPNLKINIPAVKLIVVVLGAGIMLLIIVCVAAIAISILSFRRGIDPDNTAIPITTTIIDLAGICSLILMIWVVRL
ncbi:MAG: magnesium transporter [Candidatus Thermoplasmatota archaeon]|nr:magnesium transporter [Candidatus Thermoplasmatota archaeon]